MLGNGRIPTRGLIAAVEADRDVATKGAWRWDCSENEETDPAFLEVASGVAAGAMTAAAAVADRGCCRR